MTIEVKFNSNELAENLRSGPYDLQEGATVAALLEIAQSEAGFVIPRELAENLVFLYDNRHAIPETALSDGGKLRVLHKVVGG